jgi:hypothetical protein
MAKRLFKESTDEELQRIINAAKANKDWAILAMVGVECRHRVREANVECRKLRAELAAARAA